MTRGCACRISQCCTDRNGRHFTRARPIIYLNDFRYRTSSCAGAASLSEEDHVPSKRYRGGFEQGDLRRRKFHRGQWRDDAVHAICRLSRLARDGLRFGGGLQSGRRYCFRRMAASGLQSLPERMHSPAISVGTICSVKPTRPSEPGANRMAEQ